MSLEASVYTADVTPVPRQDLVQAAADGGWLLCAVQHVFKPLRFTTVGGGTVADGDYFYGNCSRAEGDKSIPIAHLWPHFVVLRVPADVSEVMWRAT
jgi:hypothetical protein